MAHTKAQKAAAGNRDSRSKRLGVKIYGDQRVAIGNIIIRQRGMTYRAGVGARVGHDYTIYASITGTVLFKKKRGQCYVYVSADHGIDKK